MGGAASWENEFLAARLGLMRDSNEIEVGGCRPAGVGAHHG